MTKLKSIQSLPNDASYAEIQSPVGMLTIITSGIGLHAILWDNDHDIFKEINKKQMGQSTNGNLFIQIKQQLEEYFAGKRKTFSVPLILNGTQFQTAAWQALQTIPYGSTITYSEQAQKLGNKNKARAVGLANGLNPLSIVIPCHRVIGSNGKLTGFAGGLQKKAKLLQLEQEFSNAI